MLTLSKVDIEKIQKLSSCNFENQILYDMCKKTPQHSDEEEIAGKVLLIGRSNIAAIESGINKAYKGDKFYRYEVAVNMKKVGEDLDNKLNKLREYPKVTAQILGDLLETHIFLMKIFYQVSGKDNRSLASKYLHFHLPNVFYIYDSRVNIGISKLQTSDKILKEKLQEFNSDKSYLDFISKVYPLNEKIYNEYGIWLTPRQIDTLILEY